MLGMDVIDDVKSGQISKVLENIVMVEDILKFHKGTSPPATCTTNKNQKVINSFWTSPDIDILQCEFLPFHNTLGSYSDHRIIWTDIHNQSLYGHFSQKIFRAPASKFKSIDPASRKK